MPFHVDHFAAHKSLVYFQINNNALAWFKVMATVFASVDG